MTVLPFATQIKNAGAAIEANSPIKGEVIFCVQGVISPLLANLFLHYAFDVWMTRHFPAVRFERYADDAICHCASEEQATTLWRGLGWRFFCGWVTPPPGKDE